MGKLTKKFVWMMFTLVLVATLLPIHGMRVKAATTVASGTCGAEGNEENVTWVYDDEGTLTISGSGAMADYEDTLMGKAEWYTYRNSVKKIVFEEGVTTVGYWAFVGMGESEVIFADSIREIKYKAFSGNYNLKKITLPPNLEGLDHAFDGLSGSIVIPGSCGLEALAVFGSCDFDFITIEEGVEGIGYNAFSGNFRRLWLPSTISMMRDDSFPDVSADLDFIPVCYGCNDYVKTYANVKGYIYMDSSTEYSLDKAEIFIDSDNFVFDGNEKKPAVTVKYIDSDKNVPLYEGYDYRVDYINNTDIGQAKVIITGLGCYTGRIEKTYNIYGDLNKTNASLEYDKVLYDGSSKTPDIAIKMDNVTLVKDTDYTVSYENNKEEGTATVTVTGIGNYKGSIQKIFNIYKNDISKANVTLSYEKTGYDGATKEPAVTVVFGGTTLKKDVDYTVEYVNNVSPGTATVRVVGKGQYSGNIEKQFLIEGLSLENADVQLKESIYSYDGSPKTPPVTVKLGDKTLVKDTDYTLTYEDNVNDGTAYAVVTGIGIYTDIVKVSFVILPYNAGMDSVYPDGTMIDGNYVYGVTDDEKNEVELCCPATTKLTKVQVPATITDEKGVTYSVTSIGQKAFYKNTKITSLVIGNNIMSIEDYAFYGCKNISKINFGKSVEIIGGSSFRKCTKLASITLPKSIDELGKNAFYGCSKLKTITINADTVIDVNANAIKGISKKAVIKVPKKLVKKYKKEFSKKTGYKSSMKIKKK
ncbi:MAG: leucine-rich repeat domain-containing protein [Clostridiales bacterium]|nr:leucine-rich repeat domain-containing protein [Clostridiales bacterium]